MKWFEILYNTKRPDSLPKVSEYAAVCEQIDSISASSTADEKAARQKELAKWVLSNGTLSKQFIQKMNDSFLETQKFDRIRKFVTDTVSKINFEEDDKTLSGYGRFMSQIYETRGTIILSDPDDVSATIGMQADSQEEKPFNKEQTLEFIREVKALGTFREMVEFSYKWNLNTLDFTKLLKNRENPFAPEVMVIPLVAAALSKYKTFSRFDLAPLYFALTGFQEKDNEDASLIAKLQDVFKKLDNPDEIGHFDIEGLKSKTEAYSAVYGNSVLYKTLVNDVMKYDIIDKNTPELYSYMSEPTKKFTYSQIVEMIRNYPKRDCGLQRDKVAEITEAMNKLTTIILNDLAAAIDTIGKEVQTQQHLLFNDIDINGKMKWKMYACIQDWKSFFNSDMTKVYKEFGVAIQNEIHDICKGILAKTKKSVPLLNPVTAFEIDQVLETFKTPMAQDSVIDPMLFSKFYD